MKSFKFIDAVDFLCSLIFFRIVELFSIPKKELTIKLIYELARLVNKH